MVRKNKKKESYSEFENVQFPCKVLTVAQPVRNDVLEGCEYTAVDRYEFNNKLYLVVLDERGRELYFSEEYFVLVEHV